MPPAAEGARGGCAAETRWLRLIIHSVLVQQKNANMVAKEFRVSYSAAKALISKANKNPNFVAELFSL